MNSKEYRTIRANGCQEAWFKYKQFAKAYEPNTSLSVASFVAGYNAALHKEKKPDIAPRGEW